MLETGIIAPDFTLSDENGLMHSLHEYRGKKVILYFYPKDMTSGCTLQACEYSRLLPQIIEKGAVVLGVSKDTAARHKAFKEKQNLKITLLADPEHVVLQMYDVWKEKTMYGKKVMGTERTTYLIDENGVIVKAMRKVKPAEDPMDMLNSL